MRYRFLLEMNIDGTSIDDAKKKAQALADVLNKKDGRTDAKVLRAKPFNPDDYDTGGKKWA